MSDELLSQAEIEALLAQGADAASGGSDSTQETQPEQSVEQAQMEAKGADNVETQPEQSENCQVQATTSELKPQPDNVKQVQFSPLSQAQMPTSKSSMDLILDVQLQVAVELGKSKMKVKDVLALGPGSVIELDKHAGEPVEVVVNNKVVARGEVVVIDENFGVRITEIINQGGRDAHSRAA